MKIKGLIFDFDGLLVNTSELITIAYERLMEKRGMKFDVKKRSDMMGRPGLVNAQFLREEYSLPESAEELLNERRAIQKDIFEERLALMEGVAELLERTANWPVRCAVASGGNREHVETLLKKVGITEYFDAVLTADDLVVSEGKPDPEIFLLAAKALDLGPQYCVVLEDAPNGILAAKAAGMKSIFVPDARYSEAFHKDADAILETLHEVTDELLKQLEQK